MSDSSYIDFLFSSKDQNFNVESRLECLLVLSGYNDKSYVELLERELIDQESEKPGYLWKKDDLPYLYSELIYRKVAEHAIERTEAGFIDATNRAVESEDKIYLPFNGSKVSMVDFLKEHSEVYLSLPLPLRMGLSRSVGSVGTWHEGFFSDDFKIFEDASIRRFCSYLSGKRVDEMILTDKTLSRYLKDKEDKNYAFLSMLSRSRNFRNLGVEVIEGLGKFSVNENEGVYSATQSGYEIDVSLNGNPKAILESLVDLDGIPVIVRPILSKHQELHSLEELSQKMRAGEVVSKHLMNSGNRSILTRFEPEMVILTYSGGALFSELSQEYSSIANVVELPVSDALLSI